MEEGDLMDRVPILLQRDRQYYDVNIIYTLKRCVINNELKFMQFFSKIKRF